MRVLIIEDNERLGALVAEGLAAHGFLGDVVPSLAAASDALGALAYDAVLLDVQLPDGDGAEWLRRRRTREGLPPVLMLTARNSLDDRIAGLDAGADDYVAKPVDSAEIAARLRALLRRPGQRRPTILSVGRLRFDVAGRTLHEDGVAIILTPKEIELVELLMRRAGTVVDKAVIVDALHRLDEEVTLNAVEALVSRLRAKLGTLDGESPLQTVRGIGYVLRDPGGVSAR